MKLSNKKLAIDFDGTIVEDAYPRIGKAQPFAFETLRQLQTNGYRLILWTYRCGEALEEAGLEIIAMNKICDIDCYWKTRDNRDMESLTHIYRIEISDKIIEPLEVESKLVKISINEAKNQLKLSYHKQALTEFLNKIK